MNGAELLLKTAIEAGVEVCFSNPGTTEMPLVNAFDKYPGIRPVLGLFEGVCTGAADGYARMAQKPAMVLLHLGPGFGNGIANLHNAKRAKTPLFNVVGEHASWHLPYDPLLAMDIEALAGSVSQWFHTVQGPDEIMSDTARAIASAGKGGISTLIVPCDYQWSDVGEVGDGENSIPTPDKQPVDKELIKTAADLLLTKKKCALIIGGQAASKKGLATLARIKSAVSCDLYYETFPARIEQGAGYPDMSRLPYLPEMAIDLLKQYEIVLCLGVREPVSFFGYPDMPSLFTNDTQKKLIIETRDEGILDALNDIAAIVKAPDQADPELLSSYNPPSIPSGKLDGAKAGQVVAALQPENAIVMEEAITNGFVYHLMINNIRPFTMLTLTGGAIGQGPACAAGAAIACPDRPVIDYQADGSAMYTVQSLWTQARENLNVTTLICSNRSYDILNMEMTRSGNTSPGDSAKRMTDLTGIDWVKMGEAQGVPSVSVHTCEALAEAFEKSLAEEGPHLIEMQI
ncbi:MAG: acetolactate synthase large subunit [Desulfobacteraceae bacterium]|jgi:acetolactate synthase-1/2/3 large subunit|nr:acetolactate synthase large subunit [Desulfobacteraceae bacterium]